MLHEDYISEMEKASDRQGISELCEGLKKRGIDSTARQTGGYMMVCSVLLSSDDGKELVVEVGEDRDTVCIQDLNEPTGDVASVAFVGDSNPLDIVEDVYNRYQKDHFSFDDGSVYGMKVGDAIFQSI